MSLRLLHAFGPGFTNCNSVGEEAFLRNQVPNAGINGPLPACRACSLGHLRSTSHKGVTGVSGVVEYVHAPSVGRRLKRMPSVPMLIPDQTIYMSNIYAPVATMTHMDNIYASEATVARMDLLSNVVSSSSMPSMPLLIPHQMMYDSTIHAPAETIARMDNICASEATVARMDNMYASEATIIGMNNIACEVNGKDDTHPRKSALTSMHACTHCRESKTACSDIRPCHRCSRLGLACGAECAPRKRACHSCHLSKVACGFNTVPDGEKCPRCKRLGLECNAHDPPPQGPRRKRVRMPGVAVPSSEAKKKRSNDHNIQATSFSLPGVTPSLADSLLGLLPSEIDAIEALTATPAACSHAQHPTVALQSSSGTAEAINATCLGPTSVGVAISDSSWGMFAPTGLPFAV